MAKNAAPDDVWEFACDKSRQPSAGLMHGVRDETDSFVLHRAVNVIRTYR